MTVIAFLARFLSEGKEEIIDTDAKDQYLSGYPDCFVNFFGSPSSCGCLCFFGSFAISHRLVVLRWRKYGRNDGERDDGRCGFSS